MKIDSLATRERFKSSGRKCTSWALAKGHNPGTLRELIGGRVPVPKNQDGPSGRIIADLRKDDLLVEQVETDKAA